MKFNTAIQDSPTLAFAEAVRKRRNEGKKIISLGIGEPDIETPEFLRDALINAVKENPRNGYSNSFGDQLLRESISQDLKIRKDLDFSVNQIIITAGAKQALQIALSSILEPSDEVVYFSPSYVSYMPQILLSEPEAKLRPINLNSDFSANMLEFDKTLNNKTKVIMLNNPHNPTGTLFSKEDLLHIATAAIRNNIYLLLDDVYELLIYNKDHKLSVIGDLDGISDRLIFINSFSKSHSIPGWRLGYACFPSSLIPKAIKYQQHTMTNVSSIIQIAARSIYENDFGFLDSYIEILEERSSIVEKSLSPYLKNPLNTPKGGFFYFIDISQTKLLSNEFCARLIDEKGVALTPGIAFGKSWDSYVRLSFGVKTEELIEGLEKIKLFITEQK